jgi:WD40 repeat protein/serine/threonine protein kinase
MSGEDVLSWSESEVETSEDHRLARALEACLSAMEAGREVDPQRLAAAHPAIAEDLQSCLQVLRLAGRVVGTSSARAISEDDDPMPAQRLGDFRIIRQVGRGGMGVVYEAEQISLRRSVALKVLPFASSLDFLQLQRFQTEAQVAAQLHHTNIVPVFSVGCERGVHYYAMQYIEGQTLAALVRDLRRLSGIEPTPVSALAMVLGPSIAEEVASGRLAPAPEPQPPSAVKSSSLADCLTPGQSLSPSARSRAYFRTVANLGVQAAEALGHAHSLGIVHRDIKPANLLVDVRGNLWVSDFGLARIQAETGLTVTGDVIGTLRYMSPEQALGRRVAVDHRSDIYSLGVTLYELLALRPAFDGQDREELLHQVIQREPRAPCRFNPAVPTDLETIVLKAMAKEPAQRYATAGELADDLRRFLELKPIRARSPTLWDRALKWGRRHVSVVAGALLALLLTVGGLATSLILIRYERDLASANEKAASASAKEARQQASDLERQLYINRVNRAYGEWRENNITLAEALLEECPSGLRGWEWSYCRRLCHLDRLTLRGHGQPIHSLAFSPDGRWIITAAHELGQDESAPGEWVLWDTATGRAIESRPTRGSWVVAVAPSGTMVAAGLAIGSGNPGTVSLWKMGADRLPCLTDEPARVIRTELACPRGLAFSPDGRRIATISCNPGSCLELWEVETGTRARAISIASSRIFAVAFRPDGKQLATACTDGSVTLYDATTGETAGSLRGHTGAVYDVAYSPDGSRIMTCGQDETVRVWSSASGRAIHVLHGHDSFVRAVAISPDGTRIASASEDNAVRIWDAVNGKEIGRLRGHSRFVTTVAFSPDGRRIASASEDGTVKMWNSAVNEPPITLPHASWVPSVAFSPQGSTFATACRDGVIRLWDCVTLQPIRAIEERSESITGLVISPDGTRIASTGWEGYIRLWDTATGRMILKIRGHENRTIGVAFSRNGRWLASTGWEGTVRLWEAQSGELVRDFDGPRGIALSVAISPDSKRIASAFTDGTVRVWDTADGQELRQLACENFEGLASVAANLVAFSPDGRWLAACRNPADRTAGEVRVFDAVTGQGIFTLRGHTSNVTSVAFSPDGRRIATSSFDRTVKLWETQTGQEVFTLRGHTSGVLSVAFSPDGRRLASGSIDSTAKVWDNVLTSQGSSSQNPL